jgi:hypothetical protein
MEKQIVTIKIEHSIINDTNNGRYGFTMSIDAFINKLQEAKSKGAVNISAYGEESFGDACINFQFTKERLETDEEFNYRVSKEEKRQEEIKNNELALLERLKQKYRNNL